MKVSFIYPILQRLYDFVESSSGVNVGSFHVQGDSLTDMALEYAGNVDDDAPKFLWVHYMDVHHPFLPPEEYQLKVRDSIIDDSEAIKLRRKLLEDPEKVTEEELNDIIDLYDAEILFTDEQVRHLIEGVRDSWGETLVALTADHGEHFNKRGSLSGFQFYDEKMHVPLFINGWGDTGEYKELVGLKDISPTLVDYAGLEIPDSYEGQSLMNLVNEGEWKRKNIMGGSGSVKERRSVYRDHRWKYIRENSGREKLYDLNENPGEEENIAEENPEITTKLRKEVEEYEEKVDRKQAEADKVEVGEDVKERLRMLGYDE